MTNDSVVRARIDERTKKEAAAVLGAMGLTLSDAFRLLVKRIAAERALPFEPLVPNEKTIAAMKPARASSRSGSAGEADLERKCRSLSRRSRRPAKTLAFSRQNMR